MAGIEDQIDGAESGGNANATNPNSSASGPGQFIDSTWLSVLKQHRPDIADGKSDADLLALKTDPVLGPQMTAAYAGDNQAYLAKNSLPVTPGNTYLAHFAGPQGAAKVLQADPNAPVSDILGAAAVKANPFLQGMTAQGLQAWAARRMGTSAPTPSTPQAPTSLAPPQPPPAAVPAQQPIFASAAPLASTSLGNAAASIQAPQITPTPPPIFAPPRRQIDLSGLRAALAARPIFSNLQG